MPDGCVDLILAPEPFSGRVETRPLPPGGTVAEILTAACNADLLDPQDLGNTDVYINGVLLEDREASLDVVPATGDTVNIVVMPRGGHGGAKALEAALQVAVMVAAFVVTGPGGVLATNLANAGITGATATAIQAATAAAIDITGSLALTAIFGNLDKTDPTAPTYNLQAQTNQQRPREPMPIVTGATRFAFDVAASAFTTLEGDNQYITAIYGLHYGPCQCSLEKIGETLFTAYPASELQIEYFLTPGPRNSQLYPSKVDQQSFQNLLDPLQAAITTETTGVDPCTQFEVDLYWPALYYTSSSGVVETEQSKVLIEYSPHGANTWEPVPGLPAGTDKSGDAYPAGTFYITANQRNPLRQTISWTAPLGQYDVRMSRSIRPGGDTSRDTDDVYWTALRSINTAEPAIVDETLSVIVLKAMASQDFDGTLGTVSGVVTPLTPVWDADTETWPGDPTTYDATNWQPTSNAAAIARYVLTGYPAAIPLLASEIDVTFGTHYALIEEMGWTGGFTQTSDATQSDLLVKLGKQGRCTFFWDGAAMRCIPDYEKPAPRQVYSGRNAKNYTYKRIFPNPIHAVWVDFVNSDVDWTQDGQFVYNDGYTAANATLFETLTLDYACNTARAYTEGRVYLAKRTLLTETHSWTAGIDSVASFYGDRVVVRHNSTSFGLGEARVLYRRWAGDLVSAVRLDTAFDLDPAQSYAIDCRRADQVLRSLPLATASGMVREITFATPLAEDEAPCKGDLILLGVVGVISEDVELVDVTPQADGTAKLTAQAYRWDDIIEAQTGPIPPLQSALTQRDAAPVPIIQGATGDPSGVVVSFTVVPQRQSTIVGFTARWRQSPDENAASSWNPLPPLSANATQVVTPPITEAQTPPSGLDEPYDIDVEIRTVLSTGEISQPAQALNIVVRQGVYAPEDVTAVPAVRTGADGTSYPVIALTWTPVTQGSVAYLDVQMQPAGSNPAAWVASNSGPFAAGVGAGDLTDVLGGNAYDLRVRFRTSDNWWSDWVELDNVSATANSLVASGVTDDGLAAILAQVDSAIQTAVNEDDGALTAAEATAAAALVEVRALAATVAKSAILSANRIAAATAALFIAGAPLGDVVQAQQITTDTLVQNQSLQGVVSPDGNAWMFNLDTIQDQDGVSFASKFDTLNAQIGDANSAITNQQLAQAAVNTSTASLLTGLQTQVSTNLATYTSFVTAQTTTNSSTASTLQSLQTQVSGNLATYNSFVTAQTTTNSANLSTLQSLQTQVSNNLATYNGFVSTQTTTNSATAGTLQSLQTQVSNNLATYNSFDTTQSTTNSANATSLSTLNAQVGANGVTISQQSAAIATLGQVFGSLLWKVDVNGVVTAIEIAGASGPVNASVITLTAATIQLNGNVVIAGSLTTAAHANNSITTTVAVTGVGAGGANLQGSGSDQALTSYTISLNAPGTVIIWAQAAYVDGGGQASTYHNSSIYASANGSNTAKNTVAGASAVSASLTCLGAVPVSGSTATVTLYTNTKSNDFTGAWTLTFTVIYK